MSPRQFDVFSNPDARSRSTAPYVVVLQSELLFGIMTVVVAPLRRPADAEGLLEVQVPVMLDDQPLLVLVLELAHVPSRLLRRRFGNLRDFEFEIRRGLDRVFTGF